MCHLWRQDGGLIKMAPFMSPQVEPELEALRAGGHSASTEESQGTGKEGSQATLLCQGTNGQYVANLPH